MKEFMHFFSQTTQSGHCLFGMKPRVAPITFLIFLVMHGAQFLARYAGISVPLQHKTSEASVEKNP